MKYPDSPTRDEVMKVRHARKNRKILEALDQDWQTSREISKKSGPTAGEVWTFMRLLENLGYVESKNIPAKVKAWRLKEGVTRELVAEELKLTRKRKRRNLA